MCVFDHVSWAWQKASARRLHCCTGGRDWGLENRFRVVLLWMPQHEQKPNINRNGQFFRQVGFVFDLPFSAFCRLKYAVFMEGTILLALEAALGHVGVDNITTSEFYLQHPTTTKYPEYGGTREGYFVLRQFSSQFSPIFCPRSQAMSDQLDEFIRATLSPIASQANMRFEFWWWQKLRHFASEVK